MPQHGSSIQQYDYEINELRRQGYKPKKIADLLCRKHSLDPNFMNNAKIQNRQQTLKRKSKIASTPVGASTGIQGAGHSPLESCKYFFFY